MICKIRLRAIYRSNPEVITFCGMIAALEEIAAEMPLRTIPLIEYVERVYVGSEGSPARFPPSTWNIWPTLAKAEDCADSFILSLTCASSIRA